MLQEAWGVEEVSLAAFQARALEQILPAWLGRSSITRKRAQRSPRLGPATWRTSHSIRSTCDSAARAETAKADRTESR